MSLPTKAVIVQCSIKLFCNLSLKLMCFLSSSSVSKNPQRRSLSVPGTGTFFDFLLILLRNTTHARQSFLDPQYILVRLVLQSITSNEYSRIERDTDRHTNNKEDFWKLIDWKIEDSDCQELSTNDEDDDAPFFDSEKQRVKLEQKFIFVMGLSL